MNADTAALTLFSTSASVGGGWMFQTTRRTVQPRHNSRKCSLATCGSTRRIAPAGAGDKVLHAQLRIGDATVMASDGQCHGPARFEGFSLALSAAGDSEAERQFAALAQYGHVRVPMTETPFASRFGMVQDRFGVLWTVAAQTGA